MARKEHRTTPKVIGAFLYSDSGAVRVESPAWFAWLAQNGTFYLEGPAGSFTARREQRAGAVFWYAFRRYRKQLYKAYLGRPTALTQARLLAVARQLAEKAGA